MHVTSSELRIVPRGPLRLHVGLVGEVGCILAEIPDPGTVGTILEEPCTAAHWGMVLRGELELRRNGDRLSLPAGTVFHVPEGPPAHTFQAEAAAVMVTFGPAVATDRTMAAALAELGAPGPRQAAGTFPEPPEQPVTIAGAARPVPIAVGRITAQAAVMGPWVFCETRFGPTSGYASGWCDLPHWGMVLRGGLAIEWEDDVEMLLAGDIFHCPAGPPGHRYEAADGATIIDFTPQEALAAGGRTIAWRPTLADLEAGSSRKGRRPVAC
ncbi:MAG: hypothetical protein ACRDGL_02170 [Candidatus Limnocylindrales bacterium]